MIHTQPLPIFAPVKLIFFFFLKKNYSCLQKATPLFSAFLLHSPFRWDSSLKLLPVVPVMACQQLTHHTMNRYKVPSSLHCPRAVQVAHQTRAQVTMHCAAPRALRRKRPLRTQTNRDLLCWTKSIFISVCYGCELNP